MFGAFYFILSARNVKCIPICFLIFIMNAHTFLFNAMIAKVQNPEEIKVLSVDVNYGCFGFLNFVDQAFLPLFLYAVFASFFGSAGYTLTLLFFSPLVSSSAYLVEPLVAQSLGYAVGLDRMPGVLTLLGAILAIVGIFFIDRGSRERVKETDSEDDNSFHDDAVDDKTLLNRSLEGSQSHYNLSYSKLSQNKLSGR